MIISVFSIGINTEQNIPEGILKTEYLLKNAPAEHKDFLISFNSRKITDFDFCEDYVESEVECVTAITGSRYMLNIKGNTVHKYNVDTDGIISKSEMSPAEMYYLETFLKFFKSRIKKNEAKLLLKGSNSALYKQNNVSVPYQDENWCSNSPDIFPQSCMLHDYCYSSGTTQKAVCDLSFRKNMLAEGKVYANLSPDPGEAYVGFFAAANLYYKAIAYNDAAFIAFCEASPQNASFPECDPALISYLKDNLNEHDDTDGGTQMEPREQRGTVFGYGINYRSYSCELWRFPNGLGGYYYLFRNCVIS